MGYLITHNHFKVLFYELGKNIYASSKSDSSLYTNIMDLLIELRKGIHDKAEERGAELDLTEIDEDLSSLMGIFHLINRN